MPALSSTTCTPSSDRAFIIRATAFSFPGMVLDENRNVSPRLSLMPL